MAKAKRSSGSTNAKTNSRPARFSSPSFEIKPKNENQRKLIQLINEKTITFAHGSAGTGKTYLACAVGIKKLLNDEFNKIIIIRENIPTGEAIGFVPGSVDEKVAVVMSHIFEMFDELISEYQLEQLYQEGRIEMKSLAFIRGANFNNSFIIIDEAQNIKHNVFSALMTRIGSDSKVVICGDVKQSDLKNKKTSGLQNMIYRTKDWEEIGQVEFTIDDCVRSEFVKKLLQSYEDFSDEQIDKFIEEEKKSKG